MAPIVLPQGGTLPWYASVGGATVATRGDIRTWAKRLLESDSYRKTVQQRLENGTLPPQLEVLLYHYAFGKPAETLNVSVSMEDMSSMTTEQLAARAEELTKALNEAKALEDALDAEFKAA